MKTTEVSFSNNQIDKLGERLKMSGLPSEADLGMLSAYRDTFAQAAKDVCDVVAKLAGIEPTTRATKSTKSIVEKLRRDGVKLLSSMQDIAGCRVTVSDVSAQAILVGVLLDAFQGAKLYDRLASPSHGYRAKHLVVRHLNKRIEIQIRTKAQHAWAQMSEIAADRLGQTIKYGQGDEEILRELERYSMVYAELEDIAIDLSSSFYLQDLEAFSEFIQKRLEAKHDLLR